MLQNALNPVENPHLLDMHNVSHKARSLMYNENILYFRKFLLSSLFLVHFLFLGWFFYAEAQSSLQPDLTVTNATLTSTNLSFTVNNIGTAPTGLYHTRIEWIRADGTSATAPTYTEYGQSTNLAAGASLPISVDFAPPVYLATPPADAVRLKITVDILSAVPESNEVNNVVEINRPLSDLTVTNATLTSTNLSFTVNNIGTAPTGLYHTRIEWIRADGTSATAPTYTEDAQTPTLAAGASLPIPGDSAPPVSPPPPPADAVRLKITVDIL